MAVANTVDDPAASVALVIPCFNPPPGWIELFSEQYRPLKNLFSELIVVNDGSNIPLEDWKRFKEVTPEAVVIHRTQNKGKGYSLREGVRAAMSSFIVFTDVDFPFDTASIIAIRDALMAGNDVAFGNRSSHYYTKIGSARGRLSRLFRWLLKVLLKLPCDDTQCGLKGMNRRGREVFLQTTIHRYLFDLEFVMNSARQQLRVAVVPVSLRSGVSLSAMRWQILVQEASNFAAILLRAVFNR